MAAALACLSLSLVNTNATAATAPSGQVAAGPHWSVTRVAGGFAVNLHLDRQLPVTAGIPTLSVDGRNLGPATESADGTSLSLVTTDPSVADASSVTTDALATATDTSSRPGGRGTATVPGATPSVLPADPAAPGRHKVTEGIYDFGDQAIPLLNIGGTRGELEGKLYLPDSRGPKPLVVFLHGRHSSCYGSGKPNPAGWPCTTSPASTEQRFPIPSFLGYDAPARALASNGYAVVSISANAINATDNQRAADYGAQARGELILDTLRMLQKADTGRPAVYHDTFTDRDVSLAQALTGDLTPRDLIGQFDLDDVGIMGHSRGGEGVTAASTLNDALPVKQQFGIKAVLPLAPVDYDRISLPNVATATILPYCDGDVENLMGQHIVDDSRHAFDDNVLRSAVLVQGANHNYFNTIWTPGGWPSGTSDDWASLATGANDPVCDPTSPTTTRLTPTQQVAVETAYVAGFFRLTLGDEKQFQPLFDGSDTLPASASFAHVSVTATQPADSRSDLQTFEHPDPAVRVSGPATAQVCQDMGGTGGVTVTPPQPYCTTTLNEAAVPHWSPAQWAWDVPSSPMLHMTWSAADGQVRVTVPPADRNISRYQQLSVKMAADEFVTTGTDVTLTVVDGKGRTWSAPVSSLNPAAVTRMAGVSSPWLRKVILQQVTVPTSALRTLDLRDIREVRFTGAQGADASAAGGVYLSDLSAENRAVGARVPVQQAAVDIVPTSVEEGSAPSTAQIAAVLSKPVGHQVTAYVSVFGSTTATAGSAMQKVTFTPGRTCVAVTVPTYGDTLPSTTASTSFKVSATDVSGGVMGDSGFGTLTVREDDGVTGGTPAPAVGTQGNACAEYAASLKPGRLTVKGLPLPGRSLTVTASGYRPGESIALALGTTPLGPVLADPHGRITTTVTLPADTPAGPTELTAKGAGSAYTTHATLLVLPTHPTHH
ncbi:alpha/beta hydrolase [Actinacidiphila guanduensis]|uniref:hypothetical protein n=1 Tax=Actinacidiphila guanduensis TaxID=310781 RepID=UPI000B803339|nr:hypothetical protein [Actinacidiphila guanduensis]